MTDSTSRLPATAPDQPTTPFKDTVALVTGGATGIGLATARRLASSGARVIIAGRGLSGGQQVADELPGGLGTFQQMDVSDASSITTAVEAVAKAHGRLDLAVLNAGTEQRNTLLTETTDDEMARIIDTDLKGTWLSLKRLLPHIRASQGSIVTVASFWGEVGMPGGSSYAAAKGGIIALTRAVAAEEGPNGVRINCVSPGAVDTPMLRRVVEETGLDIDAWARELTMIGRVSLPEEIADAIVFLLGPTGGSLTGQNLLLDGGYTVR